MKILQKHANLLVILFCTILAACLGIFLLEGKGFSMDEMDTMFFTKDWSTMLHTMKYAEGNMWLYYTSIYFWQFISSSEFFIRLLSVIFAIATIPFTYLIGKKLFNNRVATISSLFLSVHVFFISNAQNARAYTMVLFFTTVSAYCFIKFILQGSKKYIFFTVLANALAIYSHLFAVFIVGAQMVSVLFVGKKNIWKYILPAIFFTGVLSLPLFLAPSMHSGQINWITKPTIRNLIGTFLILSDDYLPIGGLYFLLFAGLLIMSWKKRNKWKMDEKSWKYAFLGLWILLPILVSFIFSVVMKPIYISAYFFICLVPFTIFVAFCIDAIKLQWVKVSFITIVLLLSFIRLYGWYTNSKTSGLVIRNYYEDYKGTAAFLTLHASSSDAIIFLPSSVQKDVDFYIQKQHILNEIDLQPNSGDSAETIDQNKFHALTSRYSRVWYVLETVTSNRVDKENVLITKYLSKSYKLKNVYTLDAMTIFDYTK